LCPSYSIIKAQLNCADAFIDTAYAIAPLGFGNLYAKNSGLLRSTHVLRLAVGVVA
jgi:hypothetical protein